MQQLAWLTKNKRKKLKRILLKDVAEYFYNRLDGKGICMSISWVVSQCLTLCGIPAQSIFVETGLINEYGRKLLDRVGVDEFARIMKQNLDDRIFTIGLGIADPRSPLLDWDHAVIQICDGTILDLTASQASRPEKGLTVKNYWSLKKDPPSLGLPRSIFHFKIRGPCLREGNIIHEFSKQELIEIFNWVLGKIGEITDLVQVRTFHKTGPDHYDFLE